MEVVATYLLVEKILIACQKTISCFMHFESISSISSQSFEKRLFVCVLLCRPSSKCFKSTLSTYAPATDPGCVNLFSSASSAFFSYSRCLWELRPHCVTARSRIPKAVAAKFKALNGNPEAKPISHLHTACIFQAVKILNASPLPYPR